MKNPNKEPNILFRVLIRLMKSNNRSLGTVFGVLSGFILGVILVCKEYESFPLVGKGLPLGYKIVGIFLSAGTGGNLSSYIGGTIDILTGDKTIIDLIKMIRNYKKRKTDLLHRSQINKIMEIDNSLKEKNSNNNNNNNNNNENNENNINNNNNNIDLPIN